MKRMRGLLLALVLLLTLGPVAVPVTAAEQEVILLAGSDFQTSNYSTNGVQRVLDTLAIHGISKADGAFFCGDYTLDSEESNTSATGIGVLKELFNPIVGNRMTFVQGNHDHKDAVGLSRAGNNDPASGLYGVFVIHEDQYREWGNDRKATETMVKSLRSYLEEKQRSGWKRPVFVLGHIPLHWSNRTLKDGSGTDADLIFDALNEYGEKGMNLFYLYGHNHSSGYDDFMGAGAVYLKKGDTMEVCHGDKKEHKPRTLRFTYMNAGFIGYYKTDEKTADATLTMSVFRVKGNEVIVTRYDGDFSMTDGRMGIHDLKSKGVWHPDWNKEGYHATPNTQVYASSRRVTATADLPVDTPLPGESTTAVSTTIATTTVGGGVTVQKSTTSKTAPTKTAPTKTASTTETAATETAPVATSAPEGSTTAQEGTEPTAMPTGTTVAEVVSVPAEPNTDGKCSVWVWIGGVGGVLVLAGVGTALVLVRKKKR